VRDDYFIKGACEVSETRAKPSIHISAGLTSSVNPGEVAKYQMSETKTVELLPCPFCGDAPDISTRMDEDLWSKNIVMWTFVSCANCDIGFEWPPGADAVAQWNNRAAAPAPSEAPNITEAAPNTTPEGEPKWKLDSRPKKGGWAPGDYHQCCHICRCEFIGDKRAITCADCAYEANATTAQSGSPLVDGPEGELARLKEAVISALTGYEDGWHKLRSERDELKAKLADIAGLPEKWRWLYEHPSYKALAAVRCADELQAALGQG
jgi:hypothetical protein